MTASNRGGAGAQISDRQPTEMELLLPFHAAGTLSGHDARRVDAAIAHDADLARQYQQVQSEYAETILLNENLGAPSARAMQKLFAAIDVEPAHTLSQPYNPMRTISAFFSALSPRTLATSAFIGAIALLLQAGVIGVLVKNLVGGSIQTASYQPQPTAGTFALVRFVPDANIDDISQLLRSYDGTIVSGPQAGMFRIKFGEKVLSKQDAAELLMRIQGEKIVNLVVSAE
jgi:hypothetical protein